jgi:hypothetical protein
VFSVRFSFLIVATLAIAGGTWPSIARAGGYYDVFSPYLMPNDPLFQDSLCSVLIKFADSKFSFHGYDYAASEGYIIDDSGFIASVRPAPPTPRRSDFENGKALVARDITENEISEIQHFAREAIVKGYEKSVQPLMREIVRRVEDRLPRENTSFGIVRQRESGKIVGVLRYFEGYISRGRVILPALDILRDRELFNAEDEAHVKQRLRASGTDGFESRIENPVAEIGQFYIDPELSREERDQVRVHLLSWLLVRHVEAAAPSSLAVIHVSTPIHQRLYKRDYGFREPFVRDSFTDPATNIVEKTLETPMASLRDHLRLLLGLK